MKELIGTHVCEDSLGKKIVVNEYAEIHKTRRISGRVGKYQGARKCQTSLGWANDLEDGTYQLQDGRIVRKLES